MLSPELFEQPELLYVAIGLASLILALILLSVFVRRSRRTRERATPEVASLRTTLGRTRSELWSRIQAAFERSSGKESYLQDLEEALIAADVGVHAARALLDGLEREVHDRRDPGALRDALRARMVRLLAADADPPSEAAPVVLLIVGVNGVGKTTTISKLAYMYVQAGKKVLLVAADTFRAAAGDQLAHWAERLGVACVRQPSGSDPSAVAFDGMQAAVARKMDVAIVDTAGRLHVKAHLIAELQKIVRTVGRGVAGAPHEILLVIDATTGQNAIAQARTFKEACPITGVILTKLDGTAKGGAIFAVRAELDLPIRYVSYGESPEQFAVFDPLAFVDAILPAEA